LSDLNYLLERKIMLILLSQTLIEHTHVIWSNVFFYLFVSAILVFVGFLFALLKAMKKKSSDMKLLQQQHVARVDVIRKEQTEKLENIRLEMLKREEDRSRQWMESEKETLHVLNGVSSLLDLSEKIGRVESERILKKIEESNSNLDSEKILKILEEIREKMDKITESEKKSNLNDKNGSTEGR